MQEFRLKNNKYKKYTMSIMVSTMMTNPIIKSHGALLAETPSIDPLPGETAKNALDQLKTTLTYFDEAPLSHLASQDIDVFTRNLPKVDLHCHLEGAIDPEVLWNVAKRHGISLPAKSLEELRPKVQITPEDKTLIDFLKKFEIIGNIFTNKQVIKELTVGVIDKAAKDGIKHLELRFSPMYMAMAHKLKLSHVMDGVLEGVTEACAKIENAPSVNLTLIVERQMPVEKAWEILALAKEYQHRGIVGMDLANDEFHFPPGPFAEVFQQARASGLHVTIHAGEAAGAENVRTALEALGAERIGHGVRSFEDRKVIQLLFENETPIELALTSNTQTGAAEDLKTHPFPTYLRSGLNVTLNTDDPAVSNITLSGELALAVKTFDLTLTELRTVITNGVKAAFVENNAKKKLRQQFERALVKSKVELIHLLPLETIKEMAIIGVQAQEISPLEEKRLIQKINQEIAAVCQQFATAPSV